MRIYKFSTIALLCLLTACGQTPGLPGQRLGKPYVVDGTTYYPSYDASYDEIGEASWYGPGFHGKYTASGETFDQNDLTAAHPTLPMPSLVRVTNLSNGKSLIVRVNDRGPFKSSRIIDLSKRSAEELGIKSIAKVRVQFLKEETLAYLNQNNIKPVDMAAINAAPQLPPRITDAGTSDGAAPITSVHSDELVSSGSVASAPTPAPASPAPVVLTGASDTAVEEEPIAPIAKKHIDLVRDAWADDNMTLPEPRQETVVETPAPTPAPASKPKAAKAKPAGKQVVVVPKPATAPVVETAPKVEAIQAQPAAAGAYTIQVGAFSSEDNAHKLVGKLSGIGEVKIDPITVGGKNLWRVRVGSFADKAAADAALGQVHGAGAPDARVISAYGR